jgi:hypothetical protein
MIEIRKIKKRKNQVRVDLNGMMLTRIGMVTKREMVGVGEMNVIGGRDVVQGENAGTTRKRNTVKIDL